MNLTPQKTLELQGQNWGEVVQEHVRLLRYGRVEIVVHDSRVIEVGVTERLRFNKSETLEAAIQPPQKGTAQ